MKAIIIYNSQNTPEVRQLDTAINSMLGASVQGARVLDGLQVIDYMEVRAQYPVSNTPALICIREDLQGPSMLDEDDEKHQRIYLEMLKEYDKELQFKGNPGATLFTELQANVAPYRARAVYGEWNEIRMRLLAKKQGVELGLPAEPAGLTEFEFWNQRYNPQDPFFAPENIRRTATLEDLQKAVCYEWITAEEYQTITGEEFPTPESSEAPEENTTAPKQG
ncbi:XkdX family protein [Paenibacillus sp. XY044]|uniref:XkdX family protein n=1 Tax=Paenibacillus sp. XY044 TaxID=2026089 RepID=UPI00211B6CE0|nr:XkdX family protein [Paenibacillus sp. XY044]